MSEAPNLTGFAGADRFRLPAALAGSLVFHALIIAGAQVLVLRTMPVAAPPPALQAVLQPPPPPAPVLLAPEPEPEPPVSAPAPRPSSPPPSRPKRDGFELGKPATQAMRQVASNLLYPPEAIARGLEGEALVMLFLDDAGNAVAARLERSSGHAILDDAAVGAARMVRALPDGTPRELLLPVRFRLR